MCGRQTVLVPSRATSHSHGVYPGKPLATCALRAAGIYGDGEERHFPRILQTLQKGLYKFNIGSPDSLVEWVYVDNLVHAHILAAQKLGEPNSPVRRSFAMVTMHLSPLLRSFLLIV